MKASPSDQRQILDIQRHDLALTALAHKLATLPEIASLNAATEALVFNKAFRCFTTRS